MEGRTRGTKKPEVREPDEGRSEGVDQGLGAAGVSGGQMEELAGLLKSLIQSQATWDRQQEADASRQEHRWRSMLH